MHRLLEHLHHGDAAHILYRCLIHAVERVLVSHHEHHAVPLGLPAYHPPQGEKRHCHRNKAHQPHNPIEREHDGNERHRGCKRAHEVGQLVSQHVLGLGGASVNHAPDLARRVVVEVTQRHARQMLDTAPAHVGRRAKRRDVRAHERREVHGQSQHGEAESPPAVNGNARSLAPVRSHSQKVARHEPHQHERHHGAHRMHSRKHAPRKRERFAPAREVEQLPDGAARFRRTSVLGRHGRIREAGCARGVSRVQGIGRVRGIGRGRSIGRGRGVSRVRWRRPPGDGPFSDGALGDRPLGGPA